MPESSKRTVAVTYLTGVGAVILAAGTLDFSTSIEGVAKAPEAIHPIVTGGAGYKMSYLPIWGGGSQMVMRRL